MMGELFEQLHEQRVGRMTRIKQMEQKTMTKKEALIALVNHKVGKDTTDEFRQNVLDCLEALGLIKFDEPKSPQERFVDAARDKGVYLNATFISLALDKAGLKIVEDK